MKKIALLLILVAATGAAHSQETRYVNDLLIVQLRSGPSFNHRNFKGLSSGTRLTLLETSDDGKWSRVRAPDGQEGWMPSQYLSEQPAASDLLESARRELQQVKQRNEELQQQLAQTRDSKQAASGQLTSLQEQNQRLSEELEQIKAISAKSIQLNEDNQRLLQENQVLKNELDVLSTDNQRLTDARQRDEFMNGAFAVLIGVFITLLVPRLWPKKQSEWA